MNMEEMDKRIMEVARNAVKEYLENCKWQVNFYLYGKIKFPKIAGLKFPTFLHRMVGDCVQ